LKANNKRGKPTIDTSKNDAGRGVKRALHESYEEMQNRKGLKAAKTDIYVGKGELRRGVKRKTNGCYECSQRRRRLHL